MSDKPDSTIEQNTSDLIIGITNVFNSGMSYEDIMMSVLGMISDILHPDRLLIFERGEETTSCTFEWHAEDAPPQIQRMQNLSNAQFDDMAKLADRRSPVLTSSVGEMGEQNERIAQRFNQRGVQRMMAIPPTKPRAGSCMTTPQIEGEVVEVELELGAMTV